MTYKMTTIVTGFISNCNDNRSLEEYIERGKQLLNIKVKKTVYVEKEIFEKYLKDVDLNYNNIVICSKEDLIFKEYVDKYNGSLVLPEMRNVEKDTIEYFLVQNNKIGWLYETILFNNKWGSTNFCWVDFGISHILKKDESLENLIKEISKKNYDCLRMSCINELTMSSVYGLNLESDDKFKMPLWFMAGGCFGGSSTSLLRFHKECHSKFLEILREHNRITWEVNIFYYVYLENPDMFKNVYYCDHDITLLSRY